METILGYFGCHGVSFCLNRTMQYGNAVGIGTALARFVGLNRTMQYGNIKWYTEKQNKRFGLNRTMQYGNYIVVVQVGLELHV